MLFDKLILNSCDIAIIIESTHVILIIYILTFNTNLLQDNYLEMK